MKTRFAFMGFRHGHITAVHSLVKQRDDAEIVACCEEHAETRESFKNGGAIEITHDNYEQMLNDTECEVVAVGDYYEKRGRVLIAALKAGKHVIGDKPLCTRSSELAEIESLAASGGLRVGCQLDLRSSAVYRELRDLIQAGEIGEVHAVSFNGQHPLAYGSRPGWYFEEGKHAGTFNDIGIHGVDFVAWATGVKFTVVNAARNWNACLKQVPFFRDSAQAMLTMENGCGVLADVSYLTPDSFSYGLPQYWRMTFWGQDGVLETSAGAKCVDLYKNGEKEVRHVPAENPRSGGYLDDFLAEIRGEGEGVELSTADVIESSRVTLAAQEAADSGATNVALT